MVLYFAELHDLSKQHKLIKQVYKYSDVCMVVFMWVWIPSGYKLLRILKWL